MNTVCRCGLEAYRPDTVTGRRQALRCSACNRLVGRCVCPVAAPPRMTLPACAFCYAPLRADGSHPEPTCWGAAHQEAPAPEGLRKAAERNAEWRHAKRCGWELGLEVGCTCGLDDLRATLAAAPAEPPRPYDPAHPVLADHPETQWNDLDERTRRPRAEARPPEGLDATEQVVAQLAGEALATRDRLVANGWAMNDMPHDAEVRAWVAARLSAGGDR